MTQARCLRPTCARMDRFALRFLRNALFSLLMLTCFSPGESSRIFTVRDSIEFTTFSDPSMRSPHAVAQQSPDGRYLFVITTKGDLDRNQLISSLWLYDAKRIQAYLKGEGSPTPRLSWQAAAVPRAQQFDSYGSILTKAQWASDSRSLLFLAENGSGLRRLYRMKLGWRAPTLLSLPKQNVTDFAERNGVIAYVAENPERTVPDMSKGPASISIHGMSLLNLLDPQQFPIQGSFFKKHDLWVLRRTRRFRVNPNTGPDAWHYPIAAANFFHLSISPSGDGIIVALPASEIPPSWRRYRSLLKSFDFKALARTEPNNSEDSSWPWQYTYIDLRSNKTMVLFDAPSAWGSGYGDPNEAIWSNDGTRAIVTNTFLPETSRLENPSAPCAAAFFEVQDGKTSCITATRYPDSPSHLLQVSFSPSGNVSLVWQTAGDRTREDYHTMGGSWRVIDAKPFHEEQQSGIRVFVRQGLNEAPTLWCANPVSGHERLLMDPNPQIREKDLGKASIFRWTDRTGYQWRAGLLKPPHYQAGVRYPLVIQTHGFRPDEFLLDGAYTTAMAAQALASTGFVVLQMEDRRDRHLQPVQKEASSFADGCADAVHTLVQAGIVDPRNVGIIGFSRTSWYVETAFERYPELFRAASISDGVDQGYVTYSLFCASLVSCKLDHEAANGGPPYGSSLVSWMNTTASFNVDKIRTPLRIEAIQWYSLLEEWELYSSLLLQNKRVDLTYIPDGQHILQQPRQRYASQQGTVNWFRYWLENKQK